MKKHTVHLRYYPGDSLEEIKKADLDQIATSCGVEISFKRIDNRTLHEKKIPREETLDKAIEEIRQDVITVSSQDERNLLKAVVAIYERYRSPRTPYSFWGSSKEAQQIAKAVADETGGGW